MAEDQLGRVQVQPGGHVQGIIMGIEVIAQDWMPQRGKMDAELVSSTGEGCQLNPCCLCVARQDLKSGLARLSCFMVHFLARPVGPVIHKRQVNQAGILDGRLPNIGEVGLVHTTLFKFSGQCALHMLGSGKQQQATRRHVQAVDGQRVGIGLLDTYARAVGLLRTTPWNREQFGRFLRDDQPVIDMKDRRHFGRGCVGGCQTNPAPLEPDSHTYVCRGTPSLWGLTDKGVMEMKKPLIAILFGLGAFGLAACDTNEGPAEELGEEIDDAADELEDETN